MLIIEWKIKEAWKYYFITLYELSEAFLNKKYKYASILTIIHITVQILKF